MYWKLMQLLAPAVRVIIFIQIRTTSTVSRPSSRNHVLRNKLFFFSEEEKREPRFSSNILFRRP